MKHFVLGVQISEQFIFFFVIVMTQDLPQFPLKPKILKAFNLIQILILVQNAKVFDQKLSSWTGFDDLHSEWQEFCPEDFEMLKKSHGGMMGITTQTGDFCAETNHLLKHGFKWNIQAPVKAPYESAMLVQGEFKPHVFQWPVQTFTVVDLPWCRVIFKVPSHPSRVWYLP